MKVFVEGWCERAAKFAPEAVAGTLAQLEAVAATEIAVSHAIVVVGRFEDARVSEADREMLWNRFRVPVFEQIVDEEGTLLAFECEAHYGLHIESEEMKSRFEGGRIEEAVCGCGRATPRWISGEEIEREENLRRIAAYAR